MRIADPFTKAAEALSAATSVALACHVNPDADALGSMLGLSNHLRAMGKETVCSFPNHPFEPPRWASLLPGTEALFPPSVFPEDPPVMVTCDVASLDRLASLGGAAVRAKTLIWNGPLGAFEIEPFDKATVAVAKHAAKRTREGKLISVAGGGDTVAALNQAGVTEDFTFVSTAGGAFLEWMEGRTLPGVAALQQQQG